MQKRDVRILQDFPLHISPQDGQCPSPRRRRFPCSLPVYAGRAARKPPFGACHILYFSNPPPQLSFRLPPFVIFMCPTSGKTKPTPHKKRCQLGKKRIFYIKPSFAVCLLFLKFLVILRWSSVPLSPMPSWL